MVIEETNEEIDDYWNDEERFAVDWWSEIKSNHQEFDLRAFFIDYLNGKITTACFVLFMAWVHHYDKTNPNGIDEISWWAIRSSCEDFVYREDSLPLRADYGEWNDEKDLKERVQFALDGNYREIWRRVGMPEEHIDSLNN